MGMEEYSAQTCRELEAKFHQTGVLRPFRVQRYEAQTELSYAVTGVAPAVEGRVSLTIEKFVGGGFAGQVYRVRIGRIDAPGGGIAGLRVGEAYAMKILVPPSKLSLLFRNLIYRLGFQGPFQLQVNPTAARAGALWQKVIRRAAGIRFGTERAVVDVIATFVDPTIGSCGEISEWVEGRTWRYEVDDRLLARWRWHPGKDATGLASPEYRAKKVFMAEMVRLLHDVGAPELARQYEWWTCKSQPNALKRSGHDDDPSAGLTAVDFRAGLALLAVLPMSPGDVPLIFKGLLRGSLVQFDRGNITKLRRFVAEHPDRFADMAPALAELESAERVYRNSVPDITHNHVRLLYSRKLWGQIRQSTITGWEVRNLVDAAGARQMRKSRIAYATFLVLGLLPILGRFLRKVWGRCDYRRHVVCIVTSADYALRAGKARIYEKIITWQRKGRVGPERAQWLGEHPFWALLHLPLLILPAFLHRLLTDRRYTMLILKSVLVRPVRLYFNADLREQWLRDMVAEGRKHHMLTEEDAKVIESQIKEPFIQKYLKSLAVHICTLPVTQIVSVSVAAWYYFAHPQLSPEQRAFAAGAILAAFQVTPISPGSLVRGLYVLYLVIRERNFKDYNIAVFLGFFKYVGYLAFPIQMTYRYPALARFMAAHWATGAVHLVPVFGERGALLEHGVFDLFYNYPLTLRRRAKARQERRRKKPRRAWHVLLAGPLCGAALVGVGALAFLATRHVPSLIDVWYAAILLPLAAGAATAVWAGGTPVARRIFYGALAGLLAASLYAVLHTGAFWVLNGGKWWAQADSIWRKLGDSVLWPSFLFPILGALGAIVAEMVILEPSPATAEVRAAGAKSRT